MGSAIQEADDNTLERWRLQSKASLAERQREFAFAEAALAQWERTVAEIEAEQRRRKEAKNE